MNKTYMLTIGLEIHLKIKSKTKLFCQCANNQDFDQLTPNTNICPVCSGQPGALPVLMHDPVVKSLRLGRALGCTIHHISAFDRKSYHYPDLPMGYQITQYFRPTCTDGSVTYYNDTFDQTWTIGIKQLQMETDTAKAIHMQGVSLLDFNRAGTPLVEIVTEPDFHDATQVVTFLKEIQRIARFNEISDADMEKGQMRVDVNISISPDNTRGTRVELKNMNSLSAISRAIQIEYDRQVAIITNGDLIHQQTRRRDDVNNCSHLMRSKEDALDYRYFPEPDLPDLYLTDACMHQVNDTTLILPYQYINTRQTTYGFHKEFIHGLLSDIATIRYFDQCIIDGCDPRTLAKWICGPILAHCNAHFVSIDALAFTRDMFVQFVRMIQDGLYISNQHKQIMEQMLITGQSADQIAKQLGFDTGVSVDLTSIAQSVLDQNPSVVQQYRDGKSTVIGFFVGQAMRQTSGKANPDELKEVFLTILG